MKKRKLGNSGFEIAPLALGTNVFGWTIDEAASFKILDAFTGGGFNLVDTADMYSRWGKGNKGGESETIIGNWLKKAGKRNDIVLATKVGADMGSGKKDTSKVYIIKAVEDSLKRLQTDHIDLYQTHFDDEITPVEETMAAYDQLVKQGKVIVIGASNMSPERLLLSLETSRAKGYPSYHVLQPQYSLCEREGYEHKYEQICTDNNLGVICYFPLASGFLTGKYRTEKDFSKSIRGEGVRKYMNEKGMNILSTLDELAQEYAATPAAISLAWLIARPSITAPIASATTTAQLHELMQATEIQLDISSINKLTIASNY